MSHFRCVEQDRVGSQPGQCTQEEATNTENRVQPELQYKPERREEVRLQLACWPGPQLTVFPAIHWK